MSKGGAGKVYFVLYLAVILELLIIIVERDEAEEHLIRKQKEAEEIVEAVMAQLNTGFGASGVNALPQDEITLLGDDVMRDVPEKDRPKKERVYQVRVSTVKIKDILGDDLPEEQSEKRKRVEEIIRLFNVSNLSLVDTLNESNEVERLTLDLDSVWLKNKTEEVLQKVGGLKSITDVADYRDGLSFLKTIVPDSLNYKGITNMVKFRFSPHLTAMDKAAFENGIKIFAYTFDQKSAGLYRIRLDSKTNNILGISNLENGGGESPEDIISIGTIQLTRKQLSKVESRLLNTLGAEVQAICQQLVEKKLDYKQFSKEVDAAVDKLNHEELGLRSKSEKIRRSELLKNITVLLHARSEDMEQNNPSFAFEVLVKEPKIETAKPCIADMLPEQGVLAGVKYVIIPFTVNNYRPGDGAPTATVDGQRVDVIPVGQPSAAGDGKSKSQRYLVKVAGTMLNVGEADVKIENLRTCDGLEAKSKINVYSNKLTNEGDLIAQLNSKVTTGARLRLPVEPAAGGKVPANEFYITYVLDGVAKGPEQASSPMECIIPCIPKSTTSLDFIVEWKYKAPGGNQEYDHKVEVFKGSLGKTKQALPTISLSSVRLEPDVKNRRFIIGGVKITPPVVDCPGVKAADKEVLAKVSVSQTRIQDKYNVEPSIQLTGNGEYEVVIEFKGNGITNDEDIKVKILAGLRSGSETTQKSLAISIPPLR